jgi:FecR protein
MNTKWFFDQVRYSLLLLAGAFAFATTAAYAQAQDAPPSDTSANYDMQASGDQSNYDAPDNAQDPPTRVARLSFVDGSVSFQPGGQGDWAQAMRNRPVSIGDKIWADNNSRAEIQAGDASVHLASMTALSFLNMDDQTTQMRLAEGTINFRVRELREGDVYEVDTPNLSFNVTEAGAFRIDVNQNGDATRVTAIRGEGEVTANGQTYTVRAGERGEFNGVDNNVTYLVTAAPEPDEFDQWSNDRDLKEDNSISARFVSRDVPGYSDLDDNGTWNAEPDYGPVWYPNTVDAGWAPYSNGYWNYVGPWGWTWIGYEPWGFAPFHYGRWAFIGARWGWCPGPHYARPVYGPAFVGFLGGGFGLGFGGGIGWFPLGFREPFRPWYHTSGVYYRNININNTRITNTTIINNRGANFNYAYARNTRAVTVASRNNFVSGQAINRGAFRVNEAALRSAQVTNRTGFTPTRLSFAGVAASRGNIARPPSAVQNRAVMARTSPAPGAANLPVRNVAGANSQAGRGGFNSNAGSRGPVMGRTAGTGAAANSNRPTSAQSGRPQSHVLTAPADSGGNHNPGNNRNSRNWSAQGNVTDHGRAPVGFGSNSGNANRSDRLPSPGSGNNRSGYSVNPQSNGSSNRPDNSPSRGSSYTNDRGTSNAQQRSYSPPSRSNSFPSQPQSRGNSVAPRGPSGPPAPSRSYSPPSRSSAPTPSSGGGGSRSSGGSHGGGNSSSHAGGSPHGRR